jgi:adenylosuccinate synthase
MKDMKIVCGANWGDEGKGLMTDYFSQKPNSIVVCSNGGAQRGHTVTTPDGIRHVFHHFGSGTFNHASTYLSEDFIVNPIIFKQEYDELMKLGYIPNVYINQNCMLTTPFDMMANQIIEENRGKNKHGSCGLGIFETIKRYKAGITDVDNHIMEYYLEQFERENIILTDEWSRIFFDNGIFEHFLDDWDFMNNHSLAISDNYFLNQFDNIVFEAAQGLLLDQNNTEYFPHLTPSNTGIKNPKRIIENVEWNDEINIETCYVSRTYLTRHGAGKFQSECNKKFINEYMFDKTNVPNPFQDTLRYGTLDLGELYSRCSDDIENFGDEKSIAITHCNEYDWDNDKLIELFKDWNIYYSDGETHNDVN